ncbi:MAG: glycosyltransferase family 39 protein, partial [bacterium]|nr:glycosyltransferase family 39 protein [bacterium]
MPNSRAQFTQWLMLPLLLFVWWASFQYFDEMLWYDEYWSYTYAFGNTPTSTMSSPADVITRVIEAGAWERHPPGYYILLNASGALFGTSEQGLRFLSLFAGILTLAWVYQIGKLITRSRVGGLGGALTIGMTTFFINYTHDIRMYTVVLMCMSASLATYWQLTTSKKVMFGARAIFFMGIFWGMFSLYAVALSYAFLGVYHLLFASKKRRWLQLLLLMLIAVAGMVGWIGYYIITQDDAGRGLPGSSAPPLTLLRHFSTFYTNDTPLFLGFIIGYVMLHIKPFARPTLWIIILTGGTLAGLMVISTFTPFYHPRSMMTLFPFVALIGAMAYGAMHSNRARYGLVMAIWVVAFSLQWANLSPTLAPGAPLKSDWETVTTFLDDCARPTDMALFFFDEVSPQLWTDVLNFYLPQTPYRKSELAMVMRSAGQVNDMLTNTTNIWLTTFKRPHFVTYRDYVKQFEEAVSLNFALCPIQ